MVVNVSIVVHVSIVVSDGKQRTNNYINMETFDIKKTQALGTTKSGNDDGTDTGGFMESTLG